MLSYFERRLEWRSFHHACIEAQLDLIECVPQPMVLCEGGQVRGGEIEHCDHCTSGQFIFVRIDHGCRLRTFGQFGFSLESLAVLLQDVRIQK